MTDLPIGMLRLKLTSTRDYLIGQALAGILANDDIMLGDIVRAKAIAKMAVAIADETIRRKDETKE